MTLARAHRHDLFRTVASAAPKSPWIRSVGCLVQVAVCSGLFWYATAAQGAPRPDETPATLRDAQTQTARRVLAMDPSEVDYRKGCVVYRYGCGYGTLSGNRPSSVTAREKKTRW